MDEVVDVLEQLRSVATEASRAAIAHLPSLLGALALLLLGWLVAGWLRRLTRTLGTRLNRGLDRVLRTDRVQRLRLSPALVRLLSNLVFWIVLLAFVTAAARVADFETLSGWLERVIAYLPKLLLGALIIGAGYMIGAIVRDLVVDALDSAGIAQRALIGRLAQAATFLAAIVIGIDQIGVDVTFVTTMIAIVLGVVLAGFSLAFGLGARRVVANLIAGHALQQQFSVGQRARIGGVEGEIVEFTPTAVLLATAEGRVNVPAGRFEEEPSVLVSPEPLDG
jgi:small-conductance mechanosensitive channel